MTKQGWWVIVAIVCLCKAHRCFAQIPANYYNSALGLVGTPLKNALNTIVTNNHNAISWSDTWTAFQTTDKKPNGKVWDIYSWKPFGTQPYEYNFVSDQCGNYTSEGDCYNREHTWPQSLFNEALPMKTDLHALFASDGYVNNQRANFPYGMVTNAQQTFQQGSALGTGNSYPSYSGLCFEPIDSLKGDIARGLLYFSVRYQNNDAGWGSWAMGNGASLNTQALAVLRSWHSLDPVSNKEITRNNIVYTKQGNRNPFIDYPEFVECIWGNSTACSTLSLSNIIPSFDFAINNRTLLITSTAPQINCNIFSCTGVCVWHGAYTQPITLHNCTPGLYIAVVNGVAKKFILP